VLHPHIGVIFEIWLILLDEPQSHVFMIPDQTNFFHVQSHDQIHDFFGRRSVIDVIAEKNYFGRIFRRLYLPYAFEETFKRIEQPVNVAYRSNHFDSMSPPK
jgi:hypothetical protein